MEAEVSARAPIREDLPATSVPCAYPGCSVLTPFNSVTGAPARCCGSAHERIFLRLDQCPSVVEGPLISISVFGPGLGAWAPIELLVSLDMLVGALAAYVLAVFLECSPLEESSFHRLWQILLGRVSYMTRTLICCSLRLLAIRSSGGAGTRALPLRGLVFGPIPYYPSPACLCLPHFPVLTLILILSDLSLLGGLRQTGLLFLVYAIASPAPTLPSDRGWLSLFLSCLRTQMDPCPCVCSGCHQFTPGGDPQFVCLLPGCLDFGYYDPLTHQRERCCGIAHEQMFVRLENCSSVLPDGPYFSIFVYGPDHEIPSPPVELLMSSGMLVEAMADYVFMVFLGFNPNSKDLCGGLVDGGATPCRWQLRLIPGNVVVPDSDATLLSPLPLGPILRPLPAIRVASEVGVMSRSVLRVSRLGLPSAVTLDALGSLSGILPGSDGAFVSSVPDSVSSSVILRGLWPMPSASVFFPWLTSRGNCMLGSVVCLCSLRPRAGSLLSIRPLRPRSGRYRHPLPAC